MIGFCLLHLISGRLYLEAAALQLALGLGSFSLSFPDTLRRAMGLGSVNLHACH